MEGKSRKTLIAFLSIKSNKNKISLFSEDNKLLINQIDKSKSFINQSEEDKNILLYLNHFINHYNYLYKFIYNFINYILYKAKDYIYFKLIICL